jgi:hypothetical protein
VQGPDSDPITSLLKVISTCKYGSRNEKKLTVFGEGVGEEELVMRKGLGLFLQIWFMIVWYFHG